ncbi:hypothetical protein LTR10_013353 [Elasticomyces elasticus]|uniref:Heterokaryon incompatibility domain-containing protein n=1 Tax=Exophiala sideris TaxID=1016849 RepID=A0ABR0J4P9_9EURO|nr:hypothetical protein LTR10_013353 [Elasticomyces elasticus]KAK5027418.1 hypothetical protein LTS07_007020 [Exophiala sideris]KAK5034880.1 hypothetical protein LTR13_006062 [Exophiala sideris]KAK5056386.1 hypothetical protein LTR69_007927 [Exophiala sideris]KAK5181125.1 hypothetical protein LTR44_006456 [Eurotiomycetes sp. CCFEE 6388]
MSSQVYVSNLVFCREPDCRLVTGPHLLITNEYVDLVRGNAVAISYTWGDYGRRKVVIGHELHNSGGRLQEMELGLEWTSDGNDLLQALDSICREFQYCWIDQLSMDQENAAQIRKTLGRIPDIYRSLDVVALCPGKICACQTARLPWEQTDTTTGNEDDVAEDAVNSLQDEVKFGTWRTGRPNNIGFGSWFFRLWTRQEFIYAHRIQWRWISPGVLECPEMNHISRQRMPPTLVGIADNFSFRKWRDSDTFSTLTKLRIDEWADHLGPGPFPSEFLEQAAQELVHDLRAEAREIFNAACDTIHEWAELHLGRIQFRGSNQGLHRLLQGHRLESRREGPVGHLDDPVGTLGFKTQLCRLRKSHRAATQPRDYVLAVWVDCPGYNIPLDYRTMSLSDLLADALAQMHDNYGCSIATSLPAGVLGLEHPGALWSPELLIDQLGTVRSCEDIYGIILSPQPHSPVAHVGPDLHVPYMTAVDHAAIAEKLTPPASYGLAFSHPSTSSCPPVTARPVICSYDAIFDPGQGSEALALLLESARGWPIELVTDLGRDVCRPRRFESYLGPEGRELGSTVLNCFRRKLVDRATTNADEILRTIWTSRGILDGAGLEDIDIGNEWPPYIRERHGESVYQLVCQALGVDHAIARKLGLRVMVDRGGIDMGAERGKSPPRFGLMCHWLDPGAGGELETSTIRACSALEDMMRVSERMTAGIKTEIVKFAYEAVAAGESENGDHPGTQYRVVGSWLPHVGHPDDLVDGFVMALNGTPTLI